MKIEGLISDDITPLIDGLLESMRQTEEFSEGKLDQMLSEKGEDFFEKLENEIVDEMVSKYTISVFRETFEKSNKNSQEIVKGNEQMFHYFFAYIHAAHQVYHRFLEKLVEKEVKVNDLELKDHIHLTLYGNLCRQADQICLQLMNGYPDAALRLWRTFYEHCVVAVFMMKNDSNELAERFRDVTYRENKKSVESYNKRHEQLKFPALEVDRIVKTNKEYEEIKKLYGKDFFENDYSWAKPFLKDKANFLAIEEAAEMGYFRPFYIWASSKCHPTYKGIMDFRDNSGNIILDYITRQDPSLKPMIDPSQLTIKCFYEVNDVFLRLYSGHEYGVNLSVFRKIWEEYAKTIETV